MIPDLYYKERKSLWQSICCVGLQNLVITGIDIHYKQEIILYTDKC